MRVVILLNGEPYCGKPDGENSYVICCDGAYAWAKDRIKIDELIGDFDSLPKLPEDVKIFRYPVEKDMTDGELAVCRALDMGATSIVIYGGGGLREDHFLGNLHLLYKAHRAGVHAALITNRSCMFVTEGACAIAYGRGTTVSIVPFGGDAHILHSSGWKYPLENLWLRYGSTRGISNVVEDDEEATFFSEGCVLVVVNQEMEE